MPSTFQKSCCLLNYYALRVALVCLYTMHFILYHVGKTAISSLILQIERALQSYKTVLNLYTTNL